MCYFIVVAPSITFSAAVSTKHTLIQTVLSPISIRVITDLILLPQAIT